MVTLRLDKIFNPKSVAVIGASDEEGSVGYALRAKFTSKHSEKGDFRVKAYQTVLQLPKAVDLAVIATPAKTVPTRLSSVARLE